MSKIYLEKRCYDLEEAAQKLSLAFNKEVTTKDVLKYARLGQIPLSVAIYGAQKVIQLKEIEPGEVVYYPSSDPSPLAGYKHGTPGYAEPLDSFIGEGIYRIGMDTIAIRNHLHRLAGNETFGEVGNSAWYIITYNIETEEQLLFIPVKPTAEIEPLPLPSEPSLVVGQQDLDDFILRMTEDSSNSRNAIDLIYAEILGLLTETFAKSASKYQRAGRPNFSQIAKTMHKTAQHMNGMGVSKLEHKLSEAYRAWEERRG
nr:hypothetical protein [uncultured Halomonas sp.]